DNEPFDDSLWLDGATGVGFSAETGPVAATSLMVRLNFDAQPAGNFVADSKPYGVPHNGIDYGATWLATSTDPSEINRSGVMSFGAANSSQITIATSSDFDSTKGTISFWMRSSGVTGGGNYGAMLVDRRTNHGDVIVQQDDGRIFIQPEQMYGANSTFGVADG